MKAQIIGIFDESDELVRPVTVPAHLRMESLPELLQLKKGQTIYIGGVFWTWNGPGGWSGMNEAARCRKMFDQYWASTLEGLIATLTGPVPKA